jgi:hypothetical protein
MKIKYIVDPEKEPYAARAYRQAVGMLRVLECLDEDLRSGAKYLNDEHAGKWRERLRELCLENNVTFDE